MTLNWRGATTRVVIYRNEAPLAMVPNHPPYYYDLLTVRGTYTYKVCEAHTMNCSNEVSVPGGAP